MMARVRFIADFEYRPSKSVSIEYLSGMELSVKRECAYLAVAAGKAVEIKIYSRAKKQEAVDADS